MPSGLFAFVPPPFPPGSHEVTLQSIAPDGTRTAVAIEHHGRHQPRRRTRSRSSRLTTPDKPTVVLSTPASAGAAGTKPEAPAARTAALPQAQPPASARLRRSRRRRSRRNAGRRVPPPPRQSRARRCEIATVEAEEGGRLFVSGEAAPGATVRLYLNDTLHRAGRRRGDGHVSFAIGRGVRPGDYRVRLDDVDPVSGEVKSRAEVAFKVPGPLPSSCRRRRSPM